MFVRRVISKAIASRAGHLCLRATCKQCMTRLAFTALRTMATKPARQDNSMASWSANSVEEMEISRLVKPLEQEIVHQTRLIKEEQLTLERVLEDHSRLVRENDISVGHCFALMNSLKRMQRLEMSK
jgi:hypothetical protein